MVIGSALSALAFFLAWQIQRHQVEAEFKGAAQDRIEAVGRGLQHGLEAVLSLRDHLVASGRVDAESFRVFAGPVHSRHPYLQALQWLPEVGSGNRAALEEAARRNHPEFRFFTRDLGGKEQPIATEATFFAVYFVEPLAGNEVTRGYCAGQIATRQLALNRALESGGPSATGPFKLLQEHGSQSGFLVMVPVPGSDGRPKGVVQGVFRAGDLIRKSMAFLEPRGVALQLRSASALEPEAILHRQPSRLASVGTTGSGLKIERSFELAGRTWLVTAEAEKGHFQVGPGRRAWSFLAGGLAFTFLLAGYLKAILERTAEVRSLVVERTRELQQETERHRQDAQALRLSEARYRQLVEAMDEGMWILDPAGTTTFVNRRLLQMLGHPAEEVVGRPMASFLHETEAANATRYMEEWLEKGGILRDVRFRRMDGTDLWAIVTGSVVTNGDGAAEGFLAMVADITERRHNEEMQLQSQKLESLGVLAGGIAHDFNNLLSAMLGNLDLALLSLPEESPARAPLDRLEKAVQRAAHLTRQMLAYSGQGRFQVAPLDLNQTVQEISHLIAVSVPKKVTFRYHLQPGLPPMIAEAAQVQQVVMNLVTNAAEAIGDREGTVTLRTGEEIWSAEDLASLFPGQPLGPGAYLTLEVEDTGSGMSADVLERIFEPFFTTKFTRRGLGLSSMQGIVRGHGGGICIDSEVGRGTSFLVTFPVGCASEGPSANPLDDPSWRGAGRILLAEDEDELRESTGNLLRSLGFDVVAAADGREALDRFREAPGSFRAVLMDFTMPRMNGLESFHAMRELDPACRVILTSGYQEPSALAHGEDRLFAAFLQKPFDRRDLVQALAKAIEV